jgi:ATP-dependent Clp protease ATP-binding subunit ClpA
VWCLDKGLEKKVSLAEQGGAGGKKRMLSDTVTEEHIAEVVARATGIPVGSLLQGEVRDACLTSRARCWAYSRRIKLLR